ncbi:hypothetical protein D3C78_1097260 [compost metagenome]
MLVVHLALAGGDHILGNRHLARDGLVAGLDEVAVEGEVAGQVDAAGADEQGGTTVRQLRVQVVFLAVVLDHGAVGVGATVQAGAITVRRNLVAEQADHCHAVGGLPGWAEQQRLLPNGWRVPLAVGAGAQSQPGQPAGEQVTGLHAHTGFRQIDLGDGAEADQVFDEAGEGGVVVHDGDAAAHARAAQQRGVVAGVATA